MKVALIGLDAALPSLIQKFVKMGRLPNMQRLIENGVWAEGIPVFPTATASNWNSISTGAWPQTHGVTDMVVHIPGQALTEIRSGFYSDLCKAEQIWKTAERFGKKSILLKYIASWPPNIKEGIQVEGFGAPGGPGARPWGSSPLALSNSSCYSSKPLVNATKINFQTVELEGLSSSLPLLHSQISIGPEKSGIKYQVFLLASNSDGYDRVLLTRGNTKDGIMLKKGQTSDWVMEDFNVNGKSVRASFRMKLMDLGKPEDFRLFVSQVFPNEGWTFPPELSHELISKFGPFLESISHFPFTFGWTDEDTYLEDVAYQAKWMGNAAKYLLTKYEWSLFMTQWHGVDNTQHAFLRFDKSILSKQEADTCDRVLLRSYEIADELVGDIMQATKNDTCIFTLSDHGHVIGRRRFFVNAYLYQKGYIKLKEDHTSKRLVIDWAHTLAYAQGMISIYINLKGRDPDGIVNSGKEYEDLQEDLIDLLYEIKDPKTNIRPISLALKNSDAEFIGLSGDRVGDIIFAANPGYAVDNRVKLDPELFEDLKVGMLGGSIHGQQLPSVDLGEDGTIKSMFIAYGPNIKKGYTRKPIRIVDIAPTLAYALGIPAPRDCEGSIMYDIFE